MSRRQHLKLPVSTSPVARWSKFSPLHSIAPKFRDDSESGNSDDDAVDANLEEDLLMEIRTLVKKEKYLEQLEDQLRECGDENEGNASDSSGSKEETTTRLEDKHEKAYREDKVTISRLRSTPGNAGTKPSRSERKETPTLTRTTANMNSKPFCARSKNLTIAREHFRVCFVEPNPVQLRSIRALVLESQDLQINHLRTLSKNLFLFSALQSVNLANNQLDDSGSKEIRDLMCCPGLQALDLSQNLLGRLTARTICERLRHQAKLLSLDLYGNIFFSDSGETAGEIARLFAKAVAVNEFLLHFSLSVLDQTEKSVSLSEQWANTSSERIPTRPKHKTTKNNSADANSAANEFSQHLAEQLRQGGKHNSLQSLGLCCAEFSRRTVLNIVKMANRLTALDLSFAFIGIPGAQVVAASLRIDGFSTLTQLNLRCNRTKSMGAQAILTALRMNENMASLNLSHNEISNDDVVGSVVELLHSNMVLSRLDLSQNKLIDGDPQESDAKFRTLRDAIVQHRGVLSLGELFSLGANEDQACELQSALDHNRIADDQDVLESMNAVSASLPTNDAAPPRKRHILSTIVELTTIEADASSYRQVWQRKIVSNGRFSLKWRMAVKTKQAAVKPSLGPPLSWKLVVNRKCDVRGSIEDEAATESFSRDEEGSSYELYSDVAYCDKGDVVCLKLGIDSEEGNDNPKQSCKVFIKDIAFVPHHPQDRRHLLLALPQSLAGAPIEWKLKSQLCLALPCEGQEVNPASFLWEGVVRRVFIHTCGIFRLLARVQFPAESVPDNNVDTLKSRYWWQLERSSCWDPHTNHVELEGTYFDLHGVVRHGCELVFYLPSMEWMAGEYLQLSVTTPTDNVELRVVQFQLFQEVTNWERPSTIPCLNFAA